MDAAPSTSQQTVRGGSRPGAGRPAIEGGISVRVTLPPELHAEAERLAGRSGKAAAGVGIRAALLESALRWQDAEQ